MWRCGDVEMLRCGDVEMWRCGDVGMWRYVDVGMWRCGDVEHSISRCLIAATLVRGKNLATWQRRRGKHQYLAAVYTIVSTLVSTLVWTQDTGVSAIGSTPPLN